MGIFSTFYNQRKARGFNYTPLYYNKEREELRERELRIKREIAIENNEVLKEDEYVPLIRGQFKEHKNKRSRIVHKQNITRILLFIVLLYFAYLLYF